MRNAGLREDTEMKEEKTNVMRILEQKKASFVSYHFACEGAVSGVEAARLMGIEEKNVYKTLVTVGKSGEHYVFVIPVAEELDLKKAAAAVGEKSVEMIPQKDLLPLTGYVHGGCSPIGMKKFFRTTLDSSAAERETITFSAGRIGYQVQMTPETLGKVIRLTLAPLCK